jgi:hypothetical protein
MEKRGTSGAAGVSGGDDYELDADEFESFEFGVVFKVHFDE